MRRTPRIAWYEYESAPDHVAEVIARSRGAFRTPQTDFFRRVLRAVDRTHFKLRRRLGLSVSHANDHRFAMLQTLTSRPDFFVAVRDALRLHFNDGALTRLQHEMIAAYVSALNGCVF